MIWLAIWQLVKIDVRVNWKLFLDASSVTNNNPIPTAANKIWVFWWSHFGILSGDWNYILYTKYFFRTYQTLHSLSQTVCAGKNFAWNGSINIKLDCIQIFQFYACKIVRHYNAMYLSISDCSFTWTRTEILKNLDNDGLEFGWKSRSRP